MKKKSFLFIFTFLLFGLSIQLSSIKVDAAASTYGVEIEIDIESATYSGGYWDSTGTSLLDSGRVSTSLNPAEVIAVHLFYNAETNINTGGIDLYYDKTKFKYLEHYAPAPKYQNGRDEATAQLLGGHDANKNAMVNYGFTIADQTKFTKDTKIDFGWVFFEILPTATGEFTFKATNPVFRDKTGDVAVSAITNLTAKAKFGGVSNDTTFSTLQIDGANLVANGTDGFKTNLPLAANNTTATLNAVVNGNGTVTSVIVNGVTISPNPDKTYTIPLGGAGVDTVIKIVNTANDGTTTKEYTITIEQQRFNISTLQNLVVNQQGSSIGVAWYNEANTTAQAFSSSIKKYTLRVSGDSTQLTVTPTATPNKKISSITVNGNVVSDGGVYTFTTIPNSITVQVTAQDGSTTDYVLAIHVLSSDTDFSTVDVKNPSNVSVPGTWNSNNTVYTITNPLAYAHKTFTVFMTANASSAKVTIDGVVLPSAGKQYTFDTTLTQTQKTITIVITSESGASKSYSIVVPRLAASTANALDLLEVRDGSTILNYTVSGTTYTLSNNLDFLVKKISLKANSNGLNAVVKVNGTTLGNNASMDINLTNQTAALTQTITIEITAESGAKQTYSLIVKRDAAKSDKALDSLVILDDSGNALPFTNNGLNYTLVTSLTYLVKKVKLEAVTNGRSATIKMNNVVVASGAQKEFTLPVQYTAVSYPISIVITAEDGSTETYTVTITRDAAKSDKNLDNLTIFDENNVNLAYTKVGNTYTINTSLDYLIKKVKIQATTNGRSAIIKVNNNTVANGALTEVTLPVQTTQMSYSITIIIIAEDTTQTSYTVVINRNAANTDVSLSKMDVIGRDDLQKYLEYKIDSASNTYYYQLPRVTGHSFKLDLAANSSRAKIYISASAGNIGAIYDNTTLYNVPSILYITVQSEDGTSNKTVIAVQTTDERDTNNAIDSITVTGTGISFSFDPATLSYTLTVSYKVSTVNIAAQAVSSKARISSNIALGNISLGVGTNLIEIWAIAENDSVGSKYQIQIKRSAGSTDNTLTNLVVNGQIPAGFAASKKEYDMVFDRSVSSLNILPTVASTATFRINGPDTFNLGKNIYYIIVTSEMGVTNQYTLNVYRADKNYDLTDIVLMDRDGGDILKDSIGNPLFVFNPNTRTYTLTVPYKLQTVFINVNKPSTYSRAYGSGLQQLNLGVNTFTIYVKSEYGELNPSEANAESLRYTITITRQEADAENRLDSLSVIIKGEEKITNFSADTTIYNITNVPDDASYITITVAAKSDKATILGDGNHQLSLISNSSQTFTISVTSESGRKKEYKINVFRHEVVLDDDNSIMDIFITGSSGKDYTFSFNAAQLNYTVKLPGTESSALIVARAGSNKSTLTGNELYVLKDGINDAIIVFATSESAKKGAEYKIVIERVPLSSDATLKDLKIDDKTILGFDGATTSYTISVEFGITSIAILGVTNDAKSQITGNNPAFNLNVGSNTAVINVRAENGNVKTYTITIVRDSEGSLKDIVIDGVTLSPDFNPTVKTYYATVPFSQTSIDLNATLTNGDNKITGIGTKNLLVGSNTFDIVITANSGAKTTYTIIVTRQQGNADAYLEDILINGVKPKDFSRNTKTYHFIVLRTTQIVDFTNIIVSTNATYELDPSSFTLAYGRNSFTIKVKSENLGTTNVYTFNIYRVSTDKVIDDIALLDDNDNPIKNTSNQIALVFDPLTKTYNITVPFSVKTFELFIVFSDFAELVKSSAGVKNLKVGANKFEVQIISEYGKYNPSATDTLSDLYTINITRNAANSDSSLKTLELLIEGTNKILDFLPGNTNYKVENVEGTVVSAFIKAEANALTSKVTGVGNVSLFTGSLQEAVNIYFTVKVEAEDGSTTEYKITVSRKQIDYSNDNTILLLEVYNNLNFKYIDSTSFNPETLTYNIVIKFGVKSYTIALSKNPLSPAVLTGAGQTSIDASMYGTTKTHTCYATSESNIQGKVYTINVTIEAPSEDITIKDLFIDGVKYDPFNNNTNSYIINKVNTDTQIILNAVANDSKSTIVGNGTFTLNEGQNVFVITITAENGAKKDITIIVNRDYENPLLKDLMVNGEQLLDVNGKSIKFDPNVYEYYVKVIYIRFYVEIVAIGNINDNAPIGAGVKNLIVGNQSFTITATSKHNTKTEYKVHIERRGETSTNTNVTEAEILQIPQFKNDFQSNLLVYEYNVLNQISKLDVTFFLENAAGDADTEKATYTVYNNTNLKVGLNTVVIVVKAADGVTSRTYIIHVTRSSMNYEVDKEANKDKGITAEEVEGKENTYKLNAKVGALTQEEFLKFIKTNDELVEIVILSDLSSKNTEILIQVTDGENTNIVTFIVDSSLIGPNDIGLYIIIACGVCALILVLILFAVNRDKYGKIAKKRKNY